MGGGGPCTFRGAVLVGRRLLPKLIQDSPSGPDKVALRLRRERAGLARRSERGMYAAPAEVVSVTTAGGLVLCAMAAQCTLSVISNIVL